MPLSSLDGDQLVAAISEELQVVVSAGAGSGKTRLLVGRYLNLVMKHGVPVEACAAITFTEKAADQMKTAIAGAARDMARRYSVDAARWLEVAGEVYAAPITTIHSFCNAILRRYPVAAGIDPLFAIIDDTSLGEIREMTIDSFLRERMDAASEEYEALLKAFGASGLRRIYTWMLGRRAGMTVYLDGVSWHTPQELEARHIAHITERLAAMRTMVTDFHALAPGDDALTPVVAELAAGFAAVVCALEKDAPDPVALEALATCIRSAGRLGSKRHWGDVGLVVKDVHTSLKECAAFLEAAAGYFTRERGITARLTWLVLREYGLLEARFLARKKARSFLDHDDTLIETWRLLRNNIDIRQRVERSFNHILVDEFQDTDGLQMDILNMITGNGQVGLFTVGDPKQSIYRFRGADVAIFNTFAAKPSVDYKPLKTNYRSAPGVIAFVNALFSRVMHTDEPESTFEAVYTEMKPSRKNGVAASGGPVVEVAVIGDRAGNVRRMREAAFIAGRARELHEQEAIPWGAMALLLRKKNISVPYEEAFLAAGVPFVNISGSNPFKTPEAMDAANLLGWLADMGDPRLFTAVLMSPYFNVAPETIFALRKLSPATDAMARTLFADDWELSPEYIHDPALDRARSVCRELAGLRDGVPIRDLLERACDLTDYTLALLADPVSGEQSLAIVDSLLAAADHFEARGGTMREFALLLAEGTLTDDAATGLEPSDDALSILTIHKSKGMEYGVVFLGDITGGTRSDGGDIVFDESIGPGFKYRDRCGEKIKGLFYSEAGRPEKRKQAAEEKRLFYVACTRARDRLVISGGVPTKELSGAFDGTNWMAWLHAALGITSDGEYIDPASAGLFSYQRLGGDDAPDDGARPIHWREALAGALESAATTTAADPVFVSEPPGGFLDPPDHLSPTTVRDYMACPARWRFEHLHREAGLATPRGSGGMGSEYGSYVHALLERWDFTSGAPVRDRIAALTPAGTPARWRKQAVTHISRFASSPLYRSLGGAGSLMREAPFAFLHEGVLVRGSLDCFALTGADILVVDYKTDVIDAADAPAAGAQYRLQLGVYALAVYLAEGILPAMLAVHFLTPGVTVDIPCTPAFIDEVRSALDAVIAGMARGDFTPREGEGCARCAFYGNCGVKSE